METNKSIAEVFGLKEKYDSVNFYAKWNELDVFLAESKADNEINYIGYPVLIIVENEIARFATPDETYKILGIEPFSYKNYNGETL
jgi:hypothetical protein